VWGQDLKPTFEIFCPTPKKFGLGKPHILLTRRQSEGRNFETAEHIDKQKNTINALKRYQTWGHRPMEF